MVRQAVNEDGGLNRFVLPPWQMLLASIVLTPPGVQAESGNPLALWQLRGVRAGTVADKVTF